MVPPGWPFCSAWHVPCRRDLPGQVCLVFFDAEDQGNLAGWDWILGSSYFAEHLKVRPDGVVVVDMIGDTDLNIYREGNSDPALTDAIWDIAAEHGYDQQFLPSVKYNMLDDHLPFVRKGIPAVLLIDFDYPWWHTTGDTLDKVSLPAWMRWGRRCTTGW